MSWFDDLRSNRLKYLEGIRANRGFEEGMRRLMVDKYADPSHFVFELLQNAEDQGATKVYADLRSNGLFFRHNGADFTPDDVENITGVCLSDKPEQPNKIGRFGIGFKSVFAVTDTPMVFTTMGGQPFSFKIESLVVPVKLVNDERFITNGWTTFLLLFPESRVKELHALIERKLVGLGADTMLFLRHLTKIDWRTQDKEGSYRCIREAGENKVKLVESSGPRGKPQSTAEREYVQFSQKLSIDGADRPLGVSMAFRLVNGQVQPEPALGTLNVFFPTLERTGLRFRLHGPFLLNDGRANIREDSPENDLIMKECAALLEQSLINLRDMGLMSVSCMLSLPIREADFQGSRFLPLYERTLAAFRNHALVPTDGSPRAHVRASKAKITDSKPVRDLLQTDQLNRMFGGDKESPVCWASSAIQRNAAATKDLYDYMMRQLRVEEVDADKLASRISAEFLICQPDEWMCAFYALLDTQPSLWRPKTTHSSPGIMRGKPFIRTESGDHLPPFRNDGTPNVYLPSAVGNPRTTVRRYIARNEGAAAFLRKLGIEQRSTVDDVIDGILPQFQAKDLSSIQTSYNSFLATYKEDIRAIAAAIDGCSQARLNGLREALLETRFILAYNLGEESRLALMAPCRVKIASEDLLCWFAGDENAWFVSEDLASMEEWGKILRLVNAGRAVISDALRPSSAAPNYEGYVILQQERGGHVRGVGRFDPRTKLEGLEMALKGINMRRAKILWKILLAYPYLIKGNVQTCSRANFSEAATTEHRSPMGRLCSEQPWLPIRGGGFAAAKDVALEDLPSGFENTTPAAEAVAIALGMRDGVAERKAIEKYGVTAEDLALIRQFRSEFNHWKSEQAARQARAPFPETPVPDPERLQRAVVEVASQEPEIRYEDRTRSVRVSNSAMSENQRTYLMSLYKDRDGDLRCQVCCEPMPFRLDDGTPYFEAVQFLRIVRRELPQNYIALCPVCAAMFQHARATTDEQLYAAFMSKTEGVQTVPIVLARMSLHVRFNPRHAQEVRAALEAVLS